MGYLQSNRQMILKIIKGAILVSLFYTSTKAFDSWRCSFEPFDNDCFLYQDNKDDFDWIYPQLTTKFIFAAAEGQSFASINVTDRKLGDRAVLHRNDLQMTGLHCLTFAYFLYGEDVGSLNVFVIETSGYILTGWSKSGNQGNKWHGTSINIPPSPMMSDYIPIRMVTFAGTIGEGQTVEIAIDNITVAPGSCVKGTWGEWAGWGPCSSTCGNSTRTRSLVCSDTPGMGGPYCSISEAPYTQLETCSTKACPSCGPWTDWDSCSVTCGLGKTSRFRDCFSNITTETASCGSSSCPVVSNCTPWGTWTQCSKTCGHGIMSRILSCRDHHEFETSRCSPPPCPVDGGWASWRTWSSCAVVNQEVIRSRCRKCNNPTPQHGGTPCTGESLQSEQCRATVDEFRRKRKRCRCRRRQVPEIKNLTQEELATAMEETKKELTVDKKKTAKATRKKISAPDDRKSSAAMAGVLASIMFAIPALFIVGVDLMNIPKRLNEMKRKKKIAPSPGSDK